MDEYRIDPTIAYDVVTLPSGGIYYENKKKSVKVAYLTATDENILSSPNLVATNGVIDELIKRKILDRDIQGDDLIEEDRQAILIFLRNTAWGSEYNVSAIDPKTDKEFPFKVDLSVLKTKEFKLVEDSNGEFPYHFEKSNVNITFKFLTRKQEKELKELIDSWTDETLGVPPRSSKRLEMMIKSVAGSRDQMNIHNLIERLPIKDAQDFKKFVNENKPGLDLTQNVKTPSGDIIQVNIGFGVEFFRPFYGL
jgi:hypothetical protein